MSYKFKTHGTCASFIDVEMDGDKIKEVKFTGGCNGNLKAISSLVKGMTLEEVREKLQGITCGSKDTSCADQLVHAIEEASKSKNSSSL
ncbi:hypothetical protein HMPREF0380_00380 [Eubacterium infirmum F0142]|jgi:uncharacterized protein TIGR03905|nr:hypothetical protein HMPREF0380_00380 [Eubacterium infirmum F0142]STO00168.1 uncharacterized protein NCTC12940_00026 [[Eubacterium] infirmum]